MTTRARSPKIVEGSVIEAETVVDDEAPATASMHTMGQIEVLMYDPNATQIAMLARLVKAAERDPEGTFVRLADVFFRIVEGLIVNKDDIFRLEEEIVSRRLDMAAISKGLIAEKNAQPSKSSRTRRVR